MKKKGIWLVAIVVSLALACVGLAACGKEKTAEYAITVSATEHGSVTASAQTAPAGAEITLTVTPDSGYRLKADSLKYNGNPITGLKFTMPAEDVTVTAMFEEVITYAVTVAATEHGTVSVDPARAEAGQTVTVTVTPDSGYMLEENSLKANDTVIENGSFVMPAQAVTVTASFVSAPVTGISVTSYPVKDTYYRDERATALDLTGLVVTAQLEGGGAKPLDAAEYTVSTVDLWVVGEKTVKVTFGAFVTTFVVGVEMRDPDSVTVGVTYEFDKTGDLSFLDSGISGIVALDGTEIVYNEIDGAYKVPGDRLENGVNVLRVNKADSFGFIKAIKATYIATVADYRAIADDLDGYYILKQNVNMENAWVNPIGTTPVIRSGEDRIIDTTGVGGDPISDPEPRNLALGVPFTGTLDGKGYALTNFRMGLKAEETYWPASEFGKAIFGYVGDEGTVKNLTVRAFSVTGGKFGAFIAGLNRGTIENVVIDATCSMYTNWGGSYAVAAANTGAIKNVVSYVDSYSKGGTMTEFGSTGVTEGDTVTNGYIAPAGEVTALTAIAGWVYVPGVGTVYTNDNYVVSRPESKEIPLGGELCLDLYYAAAVAEKLNVVPSDAGLTVVYKNGKHYLAFADSYTLTTGDSVTVSVGVVGAGYTEIYTVTVSAAVPKALSHDGTLSWFKDVAYDADGVTLTLTYTDGTASQVHPTEMQGLDVGTLGEQTVTFFYNGLSCEVTVNVVESSVARLTLTGTPSNNVFYVGGQVTLDDLKGLTLTAYDADDQPTPVTLTTDMLNKTAFDQAGNEELTVTFGGVAADAGIAVVVYAAPTSIAVSFKNGQAIAYPEADGIDWSSYVTAVDDNDNPVLYNNLTFAAGTLNGAVTGKFTYTFNGDQTVQTAEDVTVTFYYAIGSVADWNALAAKSAPAEYYALTRDIDFANADITPVGGTTGVETADWLSAFKGVFDGNGYALTNGGFSAKYAAPFIAVDENAVVRNIKAVNIKVRQYNSSALVVFNKGTVENVYLENIRNDITWFGGIVYDNAGTLRNGIVNTIKLYSEAGALNQSPFVCHNSGTVDNLLAVAVTMSTPGKLVCHDSGTATNIIKAASFNVDDTAENKVSIFKHAGGAYTYTEEDNTVSFSDSIWTLTEGTNVLTLQRGSL